MTVFCNPLFSAPKRKNVFFKKGKVTVRYRIKIPLPLLKPKSVFQPFSQELKSRLSEMTSQYVANTAAMQIDFPASVVPTNTVTGSYYLYKTKRSVGVKFLVVSYVTHAAHPSTDVLTLNYNQHSDKVIQLSDVLQHAYLSFLSHYCRQALKNKGIESDTMLDGTRPVSRNFRHWNMQSRGLLISFGDGQVGPHAIGQPVVKIPRAALVPFLSEQGRYYLGMSR